MKINYKARKTISRILSVVLLCALGIGAISGVSALSEKLKDERKQIHPTFAVGSIDECGVYQENERSIYTKDLIECRGLRIEPDFEATGTYAIYYYNASKEFVGMDNDRYAEDGVYENNEDFQNARYARIVITPDVPTDETGKKVKDFKIRFYEVAKYAADYKFFVYKEQSETTEDLFVFDADKVGVIYTTDEDGYFEERPSEYGYNYILVPVMGLEEIEFVYTNSASEGCSIFFITADFTPIYPLNLEKGVYEITLDVPGGTAWLSVIYNPDNPPAIYGR